jgi:hypothetical protein
MGMKRETYFVKRISLFEIRFTFHVSRFTLYDIFN